MERCQHHPQAMGTEPCHGCKTPFCGSCLVTLRGERLCLKCRNRRLIALQLVESADLKLLRRIRNGALWTGLGGIPLALFSLSAHAYSIAAAAALVAVAALQICVVTQITVWFVERSQR